MKKLLFTVAIAVFFAACGSSSPDKTTAATTTPTTPTTTTTTAITTSAAGTQATSSNVQAASMAQGASTTFSNIDKISVVSMGGTVAAPKAASSIPLQPTDAKITTLEQATGRMAALSVFNQIGQHQKTRGATRAATTGSASCTDGGTVSFTASSSTAISMTFNTCREAGVQMDGTIAISGSATTFSITLGTSTTPFVMLAYNVSGTTYTSLVSKMSSAITLTSTYTAGTTTGSYVFSDTANGTMTLTDYLSGTASASTFTFTNLIVETSHTATSDTVKMNGAFKDEWTASAVAYSVTATFTDFTTATATTSTYQDVSISGTASIAYTPTTFCDGGTFTVVTNTPIRYTFASGKTTAGSITINGNTTVVYAADGTVTVTVTGQTAQTFTSVSAMTGQQCNYPTMNEGSGVFTASTGASTTTSSGTSGSSTASTMTATLTWSGGANSDMDMHLYYYSAAPSSTATVTPTTALWHVRWDGGFSHGATYSCTDASGAANQDGVSVDGNTSCDIIQDFDDTSGYGPEHITASQLPAGFYVLAVQSFSLSSDPKADIVVSLQIGSSTYGPWTYTFDSTNVINYSQPWFVAAYMTVAANGTVTVATPTTTVYTDGHLPYAKPGMSGKTKPVK